jgi:hypothetical protein
MYVYSISHRAGRPKGPAKPKPKANLLIKEIGVNSLNSFLYLSLVSHIEHNIILLSLRVLFYGVTINPYYCFQTQSAKSRIEIQASKISVFVYTKNRG